MIERIEGVPPETIGLRASGRLTREDYEPVLEPGAMVEDLETGLRAWVHDHSAWRRFALVTDVEWVAKAMRAFAWVAPGEVRVFGMGEEEAARDWVAG